jgi:hypothetical protein
MTEYGKGFRVSKKALDNPRPCRGSRNLRCWLFGHKPEPIPDELVQSLPSGFVICSRCGYSSHMGGLLQFRLQQERQWVDAHLARICGEWGK